MDALVGYGVSSGSDSDGDAADDHSNIRPGLELCCDEPVKSRNLLLEADSGSTSSDSDPEVEERSAAPLRLTAPRGSPPGPTLTSGVTKLPPPSLHTCSDTSVFSNPFKAQADHKLNVLQKHVPLTEQARPSHIGGRRICVSYRKDGRCRFGIKCKYAHDSDLQTQPTDCHLQAGKEAHTSACGPQGHQGHQGHLHDSEKPEGPKTTKKRVGLSNTLIPPKRAMKQYAMQREKEGGHI